MGVLTMPLSCSCDHDDYDYYAEPVDEFEIPSAGLTGKCESCSRKLSDEEYVLRFTCWKFADEGETDEDGIMLFEGDELDLPDHFLCEGCGEIYSNLKALGFCVNLGEDLQETMQEYRVEYGLGTEE